MTAASFLPSGLNATVQGSPFRPLMVKSLLPVVRVGNDHMMLMCVGVDRLVLGYQPGRKARTVGTQAVHPTTSLVFGNVH